jgi:hypothetical protein
MRNIFVGGIDVGKLAITLAGPALECGHHAPDAGHFQ